jgi:outer membrane protein OmpA-like peptidoglycan-associated protein
MMAGAALIGALWLGGCATEDYVNKHVAAVQGQVTDVQGQVTTVQGQVQSEDSRIGQLDQATRDAMARAEAAGRLAEGKFVYEMVLSDDSVKFPVNGSELSPEAQARLGELVQKLKADNKNVYLEIQGHTDATGSKGGNMRLGEERAEAVRLYMNQQGVPLNRMSTISYGDTAPVAPNTTRQGRAQNRRVVVIVMA